MVSRHVIEQQLHRIGFNPYTWGRTEVRELCNVMMDDEEIVECVNGEYNNGFALMAATNHRVLLVDKKPFLYLTVEDVRFEQISDFNFRNRFLTAAVVISTSNKTLHFMSYNKRRLRRLITCVQRRVVDLREHHGQAPYAYAAMQPAAAAQLPSATPTSDPPVIRQEHPRLSTIATYTRSRLPSLRKPVYADEGDDKGPVANNLAQAGDVYQRGYKPGSLPDYQAPA